MSPRAAGTACSWGQIPNTLTARCPPVMSRTQPPDPRRRDGAGGAEVPSTPDGTPDAADRVRVLRGRRSRGASRSAVARPGRAGDPARHRDRVRPRARSTRWCSRRIPGWTPSTGSSVSGCRCGGATCYASGRGRSGAGSSGRGPAFAANTRLRRLLESSLPSPHSRTPRSRSRSCLTDTVSRRPVVVRSGPAIDILPGLERGARVVPGRRDRRARVHRRRPRRRSAGRTCRRDGRHGRLRDAGRVADHRAVRRQRDDADGRFGRLAVLAHRGVRDRAVVGAVSDRAAALALDAQDRALRSALGAMADRPGIRAHRRLARRPGPRRATRPGCGAGHRAPGPADRRCDPPRGGVDRCAFGAPNGPRRRRGAPRVPVSTSGVITHYVLRSLLHAIRRRHPAARISRRSNDPADPDPHEPRVGTEARIRAASGTSRRSPACASARGRSMGRSGASRSGG